MKTLKLKHLDKITEDKIDYASLMVEIDGYKNKGYGKKKRFQKSFLETYALVAEMRQINPKEVEEQKDCKIKRPTNIDNITFSAMMEIQILIGKGANKSTTDLITDLIATTCFSSNSKEKFDIDTFAYKRFKNRVSEASAMHMLGLYNWIDKALKESEKLWQTLFLKVQVDDQDYLEAGGEDMRKFNVIETIKSICTDFNVTYDEAWQIPYAVTQTNSLSKATKGKIQSIMTEIKERKMKVNRRLKK